MKPITHPDIPTSGLRVRLQVDGRKLRQLIEAGHLCATDFACLDCCSRDALKRIFLQCSLKGLEGRHSESHRATSLNP